MPDDIVIRDSTQVTTFAAPPPPLGVLLSSSDFALFKDAAGAVALSSMAKRFQGADANETRANLVTAFMMAHAAGVHIALALNKGFVVKGKFDFEVEFKLGLALARVLDFDYEIIEQTAETCTVRGWRTNKTPKTSTYTMERARKAGLLNKNSYGRWEHPGYHENPEDQLMWRALGRVLKLVAPHALYNLPNYADEDETPEIPTAPPRAPSGAEDVTVTGTTKHALGIAPVVSTDDPNYKAMFLARAKLSGWVGKMALHRAANGILKGLGLATVASAEQLGPAEWHALWEEIDRRYDESGKARIVSGAVIGDTDPPPPGEPKYPPKEPTPDEIFGDLGDEPPPATVLVATPSLLSPELEGALAGDRDSFLMLCKNVQAQTKRVLLQASPGGAVWFVDAQILEAVGLQNAAGPVSQNVMKIGAGTVMALAKEVRGIGGRA